MARPFYDLGLGSKTRKLIRSDGTLNVRRRGQPMSMVNTYQHLINMPWVHFLTLVTVALLIINLLFAVAYFLIGARNFSGMVEGSDFSVFLQCFFFSFQTFTTVGYGHIAPRGDWLSLVAAFEAMTGLMVFAIITGLLYGRFAKPKARILFSHEMLIAPYQEGRAMEFRIVNERKSIIMDLHARIIMSFSEKGRNRSYLPLELERSSVTLFPLNWTVVHPINEKSPLWGLTADDLAKRDAEFIIVLKGFDDTFSQEVNAVHSYHFNEIVWGARFVPMFETSETGETLLHIDKLSYYVKAALS
jgi:inward rectifier potassium channel